MKPFLSFSFFISICFSLFSQNASLSLSPISDGGTFLHGTVLGKLQFDGGAIAAGNAEDETLFFALTRLDSGGHPLWLQDWRSVNWTFPQVLGMNSHSELIVFFTLEGDLLINQSVAFSSSTNQCFLVKIDTTGEIVQTQSWAYNSFFMTATAMNEQNQLFILGSFKDQMIWNTDTLSTLEANRSDGFLLRLDASLTLDWMTHFRQTIGSDLIFNAQHMASNHKGEWVVSLRYGGHQRKGGIQIGSTTIVADEQVSFENTLVLFDTLGQPVAHSQTGGIAGGANGFHISSLALDNSEQIFLGGSLESGIQLPGLPSVDPTDNPNAYFASLDSTINGQWIHAFNEKGIILDLGLTAQNQVWALGFYWETLDSDTLVIFNNNRGKNHFLLQFDPLGKISCILENVGFQMNEIQVDTSGQAWLLDGGFDSFGEEAMYEIIVYDKDCQWVKNSTFEILSKYRGIDPNISLAQPLRLYPNPVQNQLTVELEFETPEKAQVAIFDLAGKACMKTPTRQYHHLKEQFSVAHLPTGIYNLQVRSGKSSWSRRFMINK